MPSLRANAALRRVGLDLRSTALPAPRGFLLGPFSDHERNDLAGALYTAFGTLMFVEHVRPAEIDVANLALTVGGLDWADAANDTLWDPHIREETEEAMALAGPDVGSPVLAFGDPRVAIFGPVVSPAPTGPAAATLLDQVIALATNPTFFELKRGRSAPPDFS